MIKSSLTCLVIVGDVGLSWTMRGLEVSSWDTMLEMAKYGNVST